MMKIENNRVLILLDSRIYPESCVKSAGKDVEKAGFGFSAICNGTGMEISIKPKENEKCTEEMGLDFCNLLLAKIKCV